MQMFASVAETPIVSRRSERGAALITAVLLSTLLLAAGGTLILITTFTGTNAVDATAEMQAYYAAEAGVARALNVLRGNESSSPAGTTASFRNVVSTPSSWTTMSGNSITVSTSPSATFRVTSVQDPDDPDGTVRAANANYKPRRLRLRVTGIGPKNARKDMEVVIDRFTVDYSVNSVITLPNGSTDPINFNLGSSTVTAYSGVDAAGNPLPEISAFGVASSDGTAANNVIDGCLPDGTNCLGSAPTVDPPDAMILDSTNTPNFLKSVKDTRSFLYGSDGMMAAAVNEGRYFSTGAAALSSAAGIGANSTDGVLTFIDGDFVLGPGTPTGQGTLIVTGTLTLDGNFNFNGVILVLGTGRVLRSGGGHGNIYGAMFVAKFNRTGLDTDIFQAPTFDTSGGGTANIQYNSEAIEKAKGTGGHKVLAVREF